MQATERKLSIFELLCLWICTISGTGILLLMLQRFNSSDTLIIGTLAATLFLVAFRLKVSPGFKSTDPLLLLVLALALCFRYGPYLWVMGWQDQGLYINMSAYFEKHGTPFVKDTVRESLSENGRTVYDRYCTDAYYKKEREVNLRGEYPVINQQLGRSAYRYIHHQPGIYVKNQENSEYVFQFYHLHPIWLALFAKTFGSGNQAWSVVFFSLLSIVALYLLALELSRDRLAALGIALFMAVNPLHAFFAKFPVTETMAFFFSAASFYFLAKFINLGEKGESRREYLVLSSLLMGGLFFTRISGFMYMAFYYSMLLVLLARKRKKSYDSSLLLYIAGVMAIFALSALYGIRYSYPYAMDTYNQIFSNRVMENWRVAIPLLLAAMAAPVILLKSGKLSVRLPQFSAGWITAAFAAVWAVAAVKAFGYYRAEGLNGLASANLLVCAEYLSPLLLFLLPFALHRLCSKGRMLGAICIFVTIFTAFVFIVGGQTLYQYYYARYMLSEVIPYSLLLIAIYLADLYRDGGNGQRRLVVAAAAFYLLYSGYFTSFQLKGREAAGAAESLQKVADRLGKQDLLFIESGDFQVITPLTIYYGLNVIPVPAYNNISRQLFEEVRGKYRNIFLLTTKKEYDTKATFIEDIGYHHGEFEHVRRIPTRFGQVEKKLYLYRADNAF